MEKSQAHPFDIRRAACYHIPIHLKGNICMNAELIARAYAAIGENTPLKTDCGPLCGAACCFADEDDQGGVCLLPGEEAQLQGICWGRIEHEP